MSLEFFTLATTLLLINNNYILKFFPKKIQNLKKEKTMTANSIGYVDFKYDVAILTCEGWEKEKVADHQLMEALKEQNLSAVHVPWDKKEVNWRDYRVVLVLSTWDYCKTESTRVQFLKVLCNIEISGAQLLNNRLAIEWSSKKTYLREMRVGGIPTIETHWLKNTDIPNLKKIIEKHKWTICVIKPVTGNGAQDTTKFSISEVDGIINKIKNLNVKEWMLQPFAKEIVEDGEYSFIFHDGKFSHCIKKIPAIGDFRVQFFHGGQSIKVEDTKELDPYIKQAQEIYGKLPHKNKIFTRIDGIIRHDEGKKHKGKLVVMEVEMVEPYLFNKKCPIIISRIAKSIKNISKKITPPVNSFL